MARGLLVKLEANKSWLKDLKVKSQDAKIYLNEYPKSEHSSTLQKKRVIIMS